VLSNQETGVGSRFAPSPVSAGQGGIFVGFGTEVPPKSASYQEARRNSRTYL